MGLLQSLLLGVVQGLTEFLPISSSGHLVFFQSLLGMKEPQLFFDVMLHLGTLLSVVIFFRSDIREILQDLHVTLKHRELNHRGIRLLLWIILATVPTGLMGILFHDWFKDLFSKPRAVGGMLLVTGLVLWLTRFTKSEGRRIVQMKWIDAILIGIAQGMAIAPGISRSGTTISTGLFCGLDRELSGKFSFLLSIPAILGATVLEFGKIGPGTEVWMGLLGMTIAFFTGLLSLKFLMKIITMGRISAFSYYCWAMGMVIIFFAK